MTTVAELRKQLEKFPDDMLVITSPDEETAWGAESDEAVQTFYVHIERPHHHTHKLDYKINYDFDNPQGDDVKPAILIL